MREYITILACCSASRVYIAPMVIFKGVRKRSVFQNGLHPSSSAEVSDSGYGNEVLFFVMTATL
jgi:hypothetical protein